MQKIWLILCLFPWVCQGQLTPVTQEISGIVHIMRAGSYTEVFFKDLKSSVVINFDSNHNKIFEVCDESRKKGKPVQLVIDSRSRRVLSIVPGKIESKNPVGSIVPNEESQKSGEKNPEFKPVEWESDLTPSDVSTPASSSKGSQ